MIWKKWLEGVFWSGLVAVSALGTGWLSGGISMAELKMLGIAFLGGVLLYIKTHDTPTWDGVERRKE